MAKPHLAPEDLPCLFSLDSYIDQLAYEHAEAPLRVLRVTVKQAYNVLVVQTCGNCPACGMDDYQLIRVGNLYMVKQKKQFNTLVRRASLHIAGAAIFPAIEPIGRVLGWLQG